MCDSNPTVRCAAHTRAKEQSALAEYIAAWPGGGHVDPLEAMEALSDVIRRERDARAALEPAAPQATGADAQPAPARPLSSFGPVDPVKGPFAPEDGTWNLPSDSAESVVVEGRTLYRRQGGVYPNWPEAVRVEVGREITNEEMVRLAGIVSYLQRSQLRGAEGMSGPLRDGPNSFVMFQDATKTFSDDPGIAFERFEAELPGSLLHGTPVRKTDRTGPKGTRAIDGVPDLQGISVWYDDVVDSADVLQSGPGVLKPRELVSAPY